jgi:hypothetical protein
MSSWIVARTGIPSLDSRSYAVELTNHIIESFEFEITGQSEFKNQSSGNFEVSVSDDNPWHFDISYYDGGQDFYDFWGLKTEKLGNKGFQIQYANTHSVDGEYMTRILNTVREMKRMLEEETDENCVFYVSVDRE